MLAKILTFHDCVIRQLTPYNKNNVSHKANVTSPLPTYNKDVVMQSSSRSAAIFGILIALGLGALGVLLKQAIVEYKLLDRSVTVKGLAENEYSADIVIWALSNLQLPIIISMNYTNSSKHKITKWLTF